MNGLPLLGAASEYLELQVMETVADGYDFETLLRLADLGTSPTAASTGVSPRIRG